MVQSDQGFAHGVDDALGEFIGCGCGSSSGFPFLSGLFQAGCSLSFADIPMFSERLTGPFYFQGLHDFCGIPVRIFLVSFFCFFPICYGSAHLSLPFFSPLRWLNAGLDEIFFFVLIL
jgi:hypothetical protein